MRIIAWGWYLTMLVDLRVVSWDSNEGRGEKGREEMRRDEMRCKVYKVKRSTDQGQRRSGTTTLTLFYYV